MQQTTSTTLLTPIGYQSGDCGYCKGEDSSASYYARTTSLCPQHYQDLMDRGWRRSGSLLYLPDASRSCCPHYTIRLAAHEFHATRDQRQALHRWNRFVLGEAYIKEAAKKFPKTKEEKKKQSTTFDLTSTIHSSEHANLHPNIHPAHRFEVTIEPDTFTEEKFALFDNYQRHVHHEKDSDITRSGFRRFLCASPIHRYPSPNDNDNGDDDDITTNKPIGSYHQTYRLDGRLIALSVLDLLPHAVSGVYFIYHSDFTSHSFGKLSALREAALAVEQGYDWYYMGYFIWSCKKMRYKGDYRPQQVLDYDTGAWDVMDDAMTALMDKRPWVSMSRERDIARQLATAASPSDTEPRLAATAYAVPHHPNPLDAMKSALSILTLGLPGALTLAQLEAEIDLDGMQVLLGRSSGGGGGEVHEMRDLVMWDGAAVTDAGSLKGCMAELAACLGPRLVGEVVVDLSR